MLELQILNRMFANLDLMLLMTFLLIIEKLLEFQLSIYVTFSVF